MQEVNTDDAPSALGPYSQGIVSGDRVYVSGQGAADPDTREVEVEGIEAQTAQVLENVSAILEAAGASLEDVVRVRYIVPDPAEWPACWPITAEAFARARPAATMISAALQEPEMKIEIEATARLPQAGR